MAQRGIASEGSPASVSFWEDSGRIGNLPISVTEAPQKAGKLTHCTPKKFPAHDLGIYSEREVLPNKDLQESGDM